MISRKPFYITICVIVTLAFVASLILEPVAVAIGFGLGCLAGAATERQTWREELSNALEHVLDERDNRT